jgi:hypothetical protein
VRGLGSDDAADRLPFRSCLEQKYRVRADRAFLALPKYVGFFEAFLKYEPASDRYVCRSELPPSRGSSFPVPLIRMVYEANPAAISHQVSGRLPLHLCSNNTIDSMLPLCTHCIQRPLLKDPGNGQTFCTMRSGSLEKYSPGS